MCQSAPPPGGQKGGGFKQGGEAVTPLPATAPPGGIDYNSYKGLNPMGVYGRHSSGLPQGWDWDAYSAATGFQTKDPGGRDLDVRGNPITYGFNDVPRQTTPPPAPTTPPAPTVPVGGEFVGGGPAPTVPTTPSVPTTPGGVSKPGGTITTAPPVTAPTSPPPPVTQAPQPTTGGGAPMETIQQAPAPTYLPQQSVALPKAMPSAPSSSPVVNALMKRYKPQWWL